MYCPKCDLMVETEFTQITDQEGAERYERWFSPEEVRGDYALSEVGSTASVENDDGSVTDWQIGLRVDTCMNCAVPIDARTYLHHWDHDD